MGTQIPQPIASLVWALAARQHGVVALWQLLELGYGRAAIRHRVERGRLHPVRRGVFAVGRPGLTRHGELMAVVLSCGPRAVLSHVSAGALWGMVPDVRRLPIEVSLPADEDRRPAGVVVHRRRALTCQVASRCHGIPVTSPVWTLVDLATRLGDESLEAAVNEADIRDLTTPPALRAAAAAMPGRPGASRLVRLLDRRTFALTDSALERLFLPIARRAGLPKPRTRAWLNGFRVDFHWPELELVVETDGLRYHRTPAQQARDTLRDQVHAAAGLTPLRFTHAQVAYEAAHVQATLRAVAARLRAAVA